MPVFKTEFQVRGYELDGYGHVNHSVYLNYAEFARWCMIEKVGNGSDYFKRNGLVPVIARLEIDYRAPCFLAEWLVVETSLAKFRTRMARFNQRILKRDSGQLAAELLVTTMVIDRDGKAVSLPADFEERFGGDPIS